MAAPEYVPLKPIDDVRDYESPPRRPDQWRADRPGDLGGAQPRGDFLGSQGPDQGYALKLAREVFASQLHRGKVSERDAIFGCLGVALKRASLFGRAPVVHDWRVAFTLFGFLDDAPAADLVALREAWFAEVSHPHHYGEARRIVDAVPEATLRRSPDDIAAEHAVAWSSLLDLPADDSR